MEETHPDCLWHTNEWAPRSATTLCLQRYRQIAHCKAILENGYFPLIKEGKSAINLSNKGEIRQIWVRAILVFMLGRSAASNIIYVRPVGGPENTSNIGENPKTNNLLWPTRPSQPNSLCGFLSSNYVPFFSKSLHFNFKNHYLNHVTVIAAKSRKFPRFFLVAACWKYTRSQGHSNGNAN